MTLKEKYYKWRNKIVVILVILLCMSQCSTCMNANVYRYRMAKQEIVVDSLQHDLDSLKVQYKSMKDSLSYELEKSRIMQEGAKHALNESRAIIQVVKKANGDLASANKKMAEHIIEQSDSIKHSIK